MKFRTKVQCEELKESSLTKNDTVVAGTFLISRNFDRKNMQPIKIISRLWKLGRGTNLASSSNHLPKQYL